MDKDIFGRPVGGRPAHMNTFLSLTTPKTIRQLEEESGYTNVMGHIGALRQEGKVVSVGRGQGYVIKPDWFNRQSDSAKRQFLASAASNASKMAHQPEPKVEPQYWCVNFDDVNCLQFGLENDLWMMQYQYPEPAGLEYQGGAQLSATTRNWRTLAKVKIGDRFVAYLPKNRFFATGTVINHRRRKRATDAVGDVEEYVKRKDSHSHKKGFVYYTPAFYENFDDQWRHPVHRAWRYAQRIDVDAWQNFVAEGISVPGLADVPVNEIQGAVFAIGATLFHAIEDELKTVSRAQQQIDDADGASVDEIGNVAGQLDETDYFSPENLQDERQRKLAEIVVRRGQPAFRRKLVAAYSGRCVITGCDAVAALEAAHVKPYCGPESDHVTNGLLLRSDVHTLFDLDLIGIHPDRREVVLASVLEGTCYQELGNRRLFEPKQAGLAPNKDALRIRWRTFCDKHKR